MASAQPQPTRGRGSYCWIALGEVLSIAGLIEVYIWRVRSTYKWAGLLILLPMLLSHVLRRETPARLGFGWTNFRRAFGPVTVTAFGAGAIALGAGHLLGFARPLRVRHDLGDLAAYLVWGFAQQYILNGFFVNRLCSFYGNRETGAVKNLVAIEAALLFSMAHAPNWFLMCVTAAGAYFAARLYLAYRSLYALGLAHGAIGFCLISLVPDSISGGLKVGPGYVSRYWR